MATRVERYIRRGNRACRCLRRHRANHASSHPARKIRTGNLAIYDDIALNLTRSPRMPMHTDRSADGFLANPLTLPASPPGVTGELQRSGSRAIRWQL